MKKVLISIICLSIIITAFAACSGGNSGNKETTAAKTTKSATTKEITTGDAVIAESDAINLIESYSAKELGLTNDEKKTCSFLVKKSGIKYKNNYYVDVIATVKKEHEDTTDKKGKKIKTYTFDNKGEYYIRYDGKQILASNDDGKTFRELKVKAVPTTKPVTAAKEEKKADSKKQTTAKKGNNKN